MTIHKSSMNMRLKHQTLPSTNQCCILILIASTLITVTAGEQVPLASWQMLSHDVVSIRGDQAPIGYILSPNYSLDPPVDEISIITLRSSDGTPYDAILLTFEEINLQVANNCEGEALNVFIIDQNDYAIDPRNLIYSFCGTLQIEPVLVYSRNLVLQFVNDEFVTHGGSRFKIKYEFIESSSRLFNECEQPNHFKCRNRKCISQELICNGFDDCGDASDEDRSTPCLALPSIHYKNDYKCGIASFGDSLVDRGTGNEFYLTNRIMGGSRVEVSKNRLPQVSIQLLGIEPHSHICGGSLIHPMFVLTSAHCFRDEMSATSHKLLFGLRDLRQPDERQVQVRYPNHISFYPSFMYKLPEANLNFLERANYIALIELNAPVVLNHYVWPACLPHLGETITAGRDCVFMGFGETRGSGSTFALKQLKQSITHRSECRSMFSDFKIDDYNMICVRNKNFSGPCKGDSGGPLLCRNDDIDQKAPVNITEPELGLLNDDQPPVEPGDIIELLEFDKNDDDEGSSLGLWPRHGRSRYTVHGVTSFITDGSFGSGYCGFSGSPTIYARVSNHIEWILTALRLALPRLSRDDNLQDRTNKFKMFGYMFRSGYSQHDNFTPPMTNQAGE